MSEPPPVQPEQAEDILEDEPTQPSSDIIAVLRQLQPPSSLGTAATASQNDTTDPSSLKQEPTPPPPSEWEITRAELRAKPTDAELWLKLIELAEHSNNVDTVKDSYEALLEAYPNTVRPFLSMCACLRCLTRLCSRRRRLRI